MSTAEPSEYAAPETETEPPTFEAAAPDLTTEADERLAALRSAFPSAPPEPPPAPSAPAPRAEPHAEAPAKPAVIGAPWKTPGKAQATAAVPPSDPLVPPLVAPIAPAPPSAPAPAERKSGIFGRFMKESPVAQAAPAAAAPTAPRAPVGKTSALALLSNALLVEYNSGHWGKGRIESRMANLLMRVDEQSDPIDRPLPIVDDQIDATALEREQLPEQQTVPYLATLVRQIFEDAERAFGKDKAKKGYKVARLQVFGADAGVLNDPDLASKLPKA